MPVTIKFRRGTSSSWTSNGNIILASGEPGYELDTGRFKIGNGSTIWNNLPYATVVPSGFLAGSGISLNLANNGASLTINSSGATISNYGDNRVLTSDGTSTGINGESNLTFNGSLLNVNGNLTAATGNFTSLQVGNIPVSISGHSHTSSNITDFNSSVSGLLPVKDIVAGTGIVISSNSGIYTIISNGSGVLADRAAAVVTTVFNKTANTINKGSVVYINGGQGDQPTIQLAIANGESGSSKTYGITAESISSMSLGQVVVAGALTGFNTDQYNPSAPQGDVNGVTLYLSPTTSGAMTTSKPYAPNHLVSVGTIVRTHQNEGVVEVRIQNGFELDELHNVAITGALNGQFLQYNSASGLWLPSSSGNFTTLQVNNTGVSLSGHTHTSSDITNFNSSVSGLVNGIYAPLVSPSLTGTPLAPTAPSGTNTNQIATTSFVRTEISNLVDSAPSTLDTLNELAAALGDDPNFATTVTNNLATKVSATGTTNYIPKFSGSQTIANSIIYESGNNIGIGTTAPDAKLVINGDSYTIGKLGVGGACRSTLSADLGAAVGLAWSESTFIGMQFQNTDAYRMGIVGVAGSRQTRILAKAADNAGIITFYPGSGTTEAGRFHSNGRFAIGTTNPMASLHVVGTGLFTNVDIGSSAISGQSALTVNGGVTTQGSFVRTSAFSIYGDNLTQIYKPDGSTLGYAVANSGYRHVFGFNNGGTHTPWATINSTGLGIGTTTPAYKLDIIGTGNFSQNLLVSGIPIAELIDDEVASLLTAGSGISLSYNDASNSLTISTTGLQSSLSNPVTGTGISNHIAYWNSTNVITADSGQLYWDSSNHRLGIGTTTPNSELEVNGSLKANNIFSSGYLISNYLLSINDFDGGTPGSIGIGEFTSLDQMFWSINQNGSGNFSALGVNDVSVSLDGHTHPALIYDPINNFERFEVLGNGFIAKTQNDSDGYLGIETYDLTEAQVGYCLIGSRLGDGFIQSNIVRVEKAGGGLGNLLADSGNFVSELNVNNIPVSLSGHSHTSSDITDFNSSVSGLLPTISNSGDNRVLTSTGSVNGINGESNLTFNGNLLSVTGSGLISEDLRIGALKAYRWNGNAWGYDRIVFREDVNNKITSDANGNYNWLVANKNWTLSDAARVGIRTISPSSIIHIDGSVTDNASLLITGTPGATTNRVYLGNGNSDNVPFLASVASNDLSNSIYGWGIFDRGDGDFRLSRKNASTAWTSVIHAQRLTGNVGIGTGTQATSPPERLVVDGNLRLADTAGSTGNRLQLARGGGGAYDYSLSKEGNHLAISTASDSSTNRFTQFGYHSGSTWTPKTVINNFNGFLGVNTLSPSAALVVASTGNSNINLANFTNTGGTTRAAISLSSAGDGVFSLIDASNNTDILFSSNTGTSSYINAGRFGIGTSTPSGTVHIVGTGIVSSISGIAPNAMWHVYSSGSGDTVLNVEGTNGSLFAVVDNLSGSLMSVNNNAGLPVFEVFSDDRIVGGRFGQNDWVISSGGNVGIGTGIPSFKLHVIGTGNFTQNLLVNGTGVSLSGHTHTTSDITDFNSSVSGLLPTISNSGDNRLLTSTGTSTGINAESNATFNGSTLAISGAINVDNLSLDGNTLSSTNTDGTLILSSNGSGTIQRDAGGNTRGAFSVDLQKVRSSATQVASGFHSVIVGGARNSATNQYSVVCGGYANTVSGLMSSVGGGRYNTAGGAYSVVAGGGGFDIGGSYGNSANGVASAILGGRKNIVNNDHSSVVGGLSNTATGDYVCIGGGRNNSTSSTLCTIAGGGYNTSSNYVATVAGGRNNTSSGYASTVGGGRNNTSSGGSSVVGGGSDNSSSGYYSVICGGRNNTNSGYRAAIVGGSYNTVSNEYSSILGGRNNGVGKEYSSIYGGYSNQVLGFNSVCAGSYNQVLANVSHVFGEGNISIGSVNILQGAGNYINANNSSIIGSSNTLSNALLPISIYDYDNTILYIVGDYSTGVGYPFSSGTSVLIWNTNTLTVASVILTSDASYSSESDLTTLTVNTNIDGIQPTTIALNNANTINGSSILGYVCNINSSYATAIGYNARSRLSGQFSHSAGSFTNPGDAQHSVLIARRTTTNNTANQPLFLNGSSERILIPLGTLWTFTIKLSALNNSGQAAWWIFRGAIKNNLSNNVSLVGSLITENDSDAALSAASASVAVDNANKALEVRVTGISSSTIRWVAIIDTAQVSFY